MDKKHKSDHGEIEYSAVFFLFKHVIWVIRDSAAKLVLQWNVKIPITYGFGKYFLLK